MLEPVNPPGRPPAPVTLVSGPEAFLRERAVSDVVGRARAADPDVDVTWLSAAETTPGSLGEALSPSLFAAGRVAVLEGLDEAGYHSWHPGSDIVMEGHVSTDLDTAETFHQIITGRYVGKVTGAIREEIAMFMASVVRRVNNGQ